MRENWQEEKQSAWLYRALAEVERDPAKHELFAALGSAAESQADIWREQAQHAGVALPAFRPSVRARIVRALIRALGPRAIRPVLAATKVRGISVYSGGTTANGHAMPVSVDEIGGRHRGIGQGGNLRASVFGVNDGLVSNTSLIMGVAAAAPEPAFIVTAGSAGLLAGALSMAAGEYVSMRSQREMYEHQIRLEREELAQYPEEEAEELALIYHARGMELSSARAMVAQIMREPEHALNTLAREELGLNPDDLGSPWGAAFASFVAFTAGAAIPLLPFLIPGVAMPVLAAGIAAGGALLVVGAVLSLFTGRSAVAGALRMLAIGGGAAALTYGIGTWLGVALG